MPWVPFLASTRFVPSDICMRLGVCVVALARSLCLCIVFCAPPFIRSDGCSSPAGPTPLPSPTSAGSVPTSKGKPGLASPTPLPAPSTTHRTTRKVYGTCSPFSTSSGAKGTETVGIFSTSGSGGTPRRSQSHCVARRGCRCRRHRFRTMGPKGMPSSVSSPRVVLRPAPVLPIRPPASAPRSSPEHPVQDTIHTPLVQPAHSLPLQSRCL